MLRSRAATTVSLAATLLAQPIGDGQVRAPDVAALHDRYVMVWRSSVEGPGKDRYVLRTRVVGGNGEPLSEPVTVFDPGDDGQALQPRLAQMTRPNDGFELVWVGRRRATDAGPGSWAIYGRRLDAQGRPIHSPVRISEPSQKRVDSPEIFWGRSGSMFGVVWRVERTHAIVGRVVGPGGNPVGRELRLASGGPYVSVPAIVNVKAGWFEVAWTHPGWSSQAIFMREFRPGARRPVARIGGISPRRLFGSDPGENPQVQADTPALSFDYKRRTIRLVWQVIARASKGRDTTAIVAVPLEQHTHERLAKPIVLVNTGLPGAAYSPRIAQRDRAPTADVVWTRYGDCGDDGVRVSIQHRRVTLPWRVVGDGPETLSSPTDPGPPEEDCDPAAERPAIASAYSDPPNYLYAWERDPNIVGTVR